MNGDKLLRIGAFDREGRVAAAFEHFQRAADLAGKLTCRAVLSVSPNLNINDRTIQAA
jgi:hypothetical protein